MIVKKWTRRLHALVLSAALLLTVAAPGISGLRVFAATDGQLDIDGSDWQGWTAGTQYAKGMTAQLGGAFEVTVPGGTEAGAQIYYVSQQVSVRPNTTYDITYTVSQENIKTMTTWVSVKGDDLLARADVTGNTASGTKVYGSFTTGANQTSLTVRVTAQCAAMQTPLTTGKLIIDDLVIKSSADQTPDTGMIKNADFERMGLASWSVIPVPLDPQTNGAASNVSHNMSGQQVQGGQNGDYALRVQADVYGFVAVNQTVPITVKPNQTYKISYYVKTENAKGCDAYVQLRALKADGSTTTGDYQRAGQISGNQQQWLQQVYYLTTAADQQKLNLELTLSVPKKFNQETPAVAYFDNFQMEEAAEDNSLNLGFEKDTINWTVTGGQASIDTSVYHGGKQSLHITKNGTQETLVVSRARIDASLGQTFLFGGYVKSRNSINTKLRINLNCYDANGSMIKEDNSLRVMLGRAVPLSGDEKTSDWMKLMIAVPVPDDTVSIGFSVMITEGQAEVWLDDLFYRVCNLSADETLVDFSGFAYVDSDENIADWSLEKTTGNAALTVTEEKGILQVDPGAQAYMAYSTDYLVSGSSYALNLVNYSATADMEYIVRYYDYRGNLIEGQNVTGMIPAGDNEKYTISLTVPSSTTAKLFLGGGEGTYSLEKLDMIEVYAPNAAQSWLGRWIWYNEDALTQAQNATRYFVQPFTLNGVATYAPLQISCDDNYTLYVNGTEVGGNMGTGQDQWQAPQTFDILPYLQEGENVIAIEAFNAVSYAGLVYDARITLEDQTQVMVCSNMAEVLTSKTAQSGWNQVGFNTSNWIAPKEIGVMGVSPWGALYFNSALYAENQIEITEFGAEEELKADSTVRIPATITITEPITGDFPFEVLIYRKNSTKQITSAVLNIVEGSKPSQWTVGANDVVFEMYVPDYLKTGKYTLQLSDSYYYLTNEEVVDRMFATVSVVEPWQKAQLPTAEIRMDSGKPMVYIDGEAKPSIFYLSPAGDLWWDLQKEAEFCEGSGIELYVTNCTYLNNNGNKTQPIWLDEDTIDFDTFDRYIYEPLSANPNALIIVDVAMQAPSWWLDQNPSEEIVLYDSRTGQMVNPATRAVSFSSEKYRQEAGEVLRQLIEHIKTAPYASHIVGIKIQDGETQEYMTQGVEDWVIGDFSESAVNGFRKYLKELYGTEAALQAAYHDETVTFDTVTVPTWDERGQVWLYQNGVGQTCVLDPATNRITIDYHYYMGKITSDTFLHYAQIVKEASDGKLLSGAYHGYLWNFATSGVGSTHPAVENILQSENVDFICSPFIYGERDIGENAAYDAMLDGVQNAGKLYILEIDTRTVFETATGNADWDADVGYCYTMEETIASLKRDIGGLVTKGAGFWIFNMYGSWWYDQQIYDYLREVKTEMSFSSHTPSASTSDIAIFVDEMTYPYISPTDVYGAYQTLYFLFNQQRRNLATIGAGYDTYHISDLVNDNLSKEYKIHVMLSPFELTQDERAAIESKLMKDGKVILWVYLPGLSDGTKNDVASIEALTGFRVGYYTQRGMLNGRFTGEHPLTEGLQDFCYGNDLDSYLDSAGPLPYIDLSGDTEAVELAEFTYDDSKAAMAMKDMGDWTSIYSTVMNLPAGFFRNLLKYTGGHIYSNNASDIVHASTNYVSVYSLYGGERTVTLPAGNYSVYDVYEKQYVDVNGNSFTFSLNDNDAKLFRLMEAEKIAVLAQTNGGHAQLSAPGVSQVTPGSDYAVTVTVDFGYYLAGVRVNGVEVEPTNTVSLQNVDQSSTVEFVIRQVKTYGDEGYQVAVTKTDVRWGLIILLFALSALGIAVAGTGAEVLLGFLKKSKKARR